MQDSLSPVFSALADPTRRAILARLKRGEANVAELAEPFLHAMTRPAITKHLKVLEKAGLVTRGREAQMRPCKLNPEPLKSATDWLEEYRVSVEESLDRLGEYLKTVVAKQHSPRNAASKPIVKPKVAKRATTPKSINKKPKRDRKR